MATTSSNGMTADAFLTTLESKLRDPFSSVEVPKVIGSYSDIGGSGGSTTTTTTASIRLLKQVLSRAQKVTQLRVLTGLLGVDVRSTGGQASSADDGKDDETDDDDDNLQSIITMAQQAPEYDEWVRIMAGIVQGVIIDSNKNDVDDDGIGGVEQQQQGQRMMGEEAIKVLDHTCREIIDKVQTIQRSTSIVDEDGDFLLLQDDIDPNFAPYWHSLLASSSSNNNNNQSKFESSSSSQQQQNDPHHHHHFVVNESADILHIDDQIEEAKSNDEAAHDQNHTIRSSGSNGTSTNSNTSTKPAAAGGAVKTATTADFPGFRSKNKSSSKPSSLSTARPKSSLFITSKKPVSMVTKRSVHNIKGSGSTTATAAASTANATTDNNAISNNNNKTLIRKRKPGAAQALLAKGRSKGGGISKMKMMDVSESKEKLLLEEQQQQLHGGKTGGLIMSKKRPLSQPITATTTTSTSPARSAAVHKKSKKNNHKNPISEQQHQSATSSPQQEQQEQQSTPPTAGRKVEDWRKILSEHSNRITDQDRERVRQFFEEHVNPTPNDPMILANNNVYRLKLHEEQSIENGVTVKMTYYLNLDYTSFTSKQTKKRKEYK